MRWLRDHRFLNALSRLYRVGLKVAAPLIVIGLFLLSLLLIAGVIR